MMALIGQSVRFAIVGVVNTGVGLGIIYLLMYLFGAGLVVANAAGYATGVAVSFLLNRGWTFRNQRPAREVLPKYALTVAACYLMNLGMVLLVAGPLDVDPYLAQLIGVTTYSAAMFAGCRWFVFAPRCAA